MTTMSAVSDDLPRLLSLISHELRAPVGVVRGYLRLLDQQSAALADSQRAAVGGALKASDRAADLLSQLSTLAQLVRGEIVFSFDDVTLEALLADVIAAVPLPRDPAVQLHLESVSAASVRADDSMLRAALVSMLTAIVRAQPGDTTLFVTASGEEMADGRRVRLRAGPRSGDGIEESALNLARGGMGLELPIADRLIAAHGGSIRELRDAGRIVGMIVLLPASP